ncbi:sulfoacetaldehyde dehydrogenase SafD [Microbulbifer hydrolyticus]|uniref:Acyl-CoA reductase-like NAD-dependent aldehyde dehydrogenase n=1 Tax=Microbulbifer hydrolyticus TaxID=48074 RepID=A0A6P1T751_9GAMM|nr:aldehyde dehydrogenase family protein [Microbulbifer hydrolyticus]MBB5213152.1 acyl-CoA reductase-like NAD-dependent aldehyde dehydrogenase [Microbulbifer hydrolyticus]QHQ38644.1 aldehyde dehydrogenase family protein [Microbulbifer hydrolyticus]
MADYQIINPYNGEQIEAYDFHTREQVAEAIDLLVQGRGVQQATPAFERSNILLKLAQLMLERKEDLARLITEETGKTISDSRVEIDRAYNTALASAMEARNINGEALDSDAFPPMREKIGVVLWKPLGTVLCITPFNFPINIAVHKIGPAFAAGNTILFKPGPQNKRSAELLVELCYAAGMDKSVLQMLVPDIEATSYAVSHPQIQAVNFTGGTAAANAIAANAGYKKMLFELGGNDPLIVMPDADLDAAVTATINQRFATAGQRCTAAKRLFVHSDVFDAFAEKLVAATAKLKVGDPAEDDTFVGPLIHTAAADEVEARIESAVKAGARVLFGHQRQGNILWPTILDNVADDAELVAEETFGPVVPLRKFDDEGELVSLINSSPFGLQAGVFTQNLALAKRLYNQLDVGLLAVNDGPGFRAEHFPFGGVKESGVGREGVSYAIREMSYQKTLVI